MVVTDFTRSRNATDASQRAKAWMRTVREIGATFSVLVLITIGALAARMLLSLPFSVAH
jgi:hypothetical protein